MGESQTALVGMWDQDLKIAVQNSQAIPGLRGGASRGAGPRALRGGESRTWRLCPGIPSRAGSGSHSRSSGAAPGARPERRGLPNTMAEFPSKVSTRTSSPAQGVGASVSALRPDLGFVRSALGVLALLQLVSGVAR